ncbi:MAG: GTP cyclohydrolase MptA [Desulfurococcales archaeon]|nr:GTP cyclohydrolase MptA [Desulfurococcales archaeon]
MEIQDTRPRHPIPLDWVGFRGVRRRVVIESPQGPIGLDLDLDVLVGIDGDRRGAHLSRNIEAVREALEPPSRAPSLEEYLESIARGLLGRHEYATRASVRARTRYYVDIEYRGLRGVEPVEVEVGVHIDRSGERRWSVAATVKGMTVCPSAQSTIASMLGVEAGRAPSHSQKAVLTGRIETMGKLVRIEDIARELFMSFSAPAMTLLKRSQEARLILEAHSSPMFVEDLVREAVARLEELLRRIGLAHAVIEVEAVSLESIHPHDVYAYKRSVIGSGAED